MRFFISYLVLLILFLEYIFAAESSGNGTNWLELLQKIFNFSVLVGLILFFFGKKIITGLKDATKLEYNEFFFFDKKQKELEKELNLLQSNIEAKQQKLKKSEEKYYQEIEKEKNRIQKEAEIYSKKLEKNNDLILKQEELLAKKILHKKIFLQSLEKLENAIFSGKIIIPQDKYLQKLYQQLDKK